MNKNIWLKYTKFPEFRTLKKDKKLSYQDWSISRYHFNNMQLPRKNKVTSTSPKFWYFNYPWRMKAISWQLDTSKNWAIMGTKYLQFHMWLWISKLNNLGKCVHYHCIKSRVKVINCKTNIRICRCCFHFLETCWR